MSHRFFDEEKTQTRMLRCPSCKELVSMDLETCRYCGAHVDWSAARRLNEEFQLVTDAVTIANTFKQSIWGAVLISVISPIYLLISQDQRVILVWAAPVLALGYGMRWMYRYGRLETDDADYPIARRDMRRSIIVWVAAFVLQTVLVIYVLS